MKQHIVILLFILSFSRISFASQNAYYDLINLAEETFVKKKNQECFAFYDQAFKVKKAKYFAKDAYVAAQMAYYLKDDEHVKKYLKKAFELGMPLSALHSGAIFNQIEKTSLYNEISKIYSTCKKPKFDLETRERIYTYCFASDSIKFLLRPNLPEQYQAYYNIENEFRAYLFDEFLSKGQFPNENIIGIASDSLFADFLKRNNKVDQWQQAAIKMFGSDEPEVIENDFVAKFSFSVLLHSHCSFPKFQPYLLNAVENGYMQPSEYALLKETSILWNQDSKNPWDDCSLDLNTAYYNMLGYDKFKKNQTYIDPKNTELMLLVEQNRAAIHMQKWSVDNEKMKLQKELGIRFFFGFLIR
jgi:hypothetical protein